MSKNIRGRKWFDIIEHGPLFDDYLAITPAVSPVGIDYAATHKNRDEVLIATMRQWGEILSNGIAEPREAGQRLKELADEAEAIEREIGFGYNR